MEAIRLTSTLGMADIAEIAVGARTSSSFAQRVLSRTSGFAREEHIFLSSKQRLMLALEVARNGMLENASRALSWQEFEQFTEECLVESGFRAERNVRVKGDGRAWQIDVVGFRGELLLAVDCKHWNTPGYLSRFELAADHQRQATSHLLSTLDEKTAQQDREGPRQGLAVILTLREPPARFSKDAALVSVEKLPSFLSGVTPYDENLPFISSSLAVVENPMSQSN
jgi:hypothetical protein